MRDHCKSAPKSFTRRSATRRVLDASFPGVKTPGYHQTSLREKRPLRFAAPRETRLGFAAERHLMVARPFKAGIAAPMIRCVAERQLMRDHCKSAPKSFMRRSATRWVLGVSFPGVETPGYHQTSLREKRPLRFAAERETRLRFAAERHLMVARPFKAGLETPGFQRQRPIVSRSDN